jgi:type I restriction enzyme S subunit
MDRFGEKVCCNPTVKLKKRESYPLIDIDKINPGYKIVRSEETVEYMGQGGSKFQDHDILFARITPCLENGKLAISSIDGQKGIGSTELFVFRGIDGVSDTDYIYYLLCMKHIRQLAANSMTGASGRQRADLDFIKRIQWAFPNVKVQRRIASILSAYDNLIDVNTNRIKALEQMAENLYKEWFVRFRFPGHENAEFENGIPKGWSVKKVREIVKRLPFGTLYKAENTEKEGKVIVIDQSQDEYVGFHNNEPSHIATMETPIILFGDHSCKYQLMITPFSLSENVVPFVGNEDVLTAYLFYLIHGIVETTEYKRHWTEFVAKKVLVAPFDLQKLFVDFVSPINAAMQKQRETKRNLIKQRDLLLPRLMSGKLEIAL